MKPGRMRGMYDNHHRTYLIRERRLKAVEDVEGLVGAPVVHEQEVRLRRVTREVEEVIRPEPASLVVTGHHDCSVGSCTCDGLIRVDVFSRGRSRRILWLFLAATHSRRFLRTRASSMSEERSKCLP